MHLLQDLLLSIFIDINNYVLYSCCSCETSTQQDQLETPCPADQFAAFLEEFLREDEEDDTDIDFSLPITPGFRSLKHLFGYNAPTV